MKSYYADVVIVGGGIAGLWTLNLLRNKNINAVLIEKDCLGCGQTLASQGMIHGGQRYALQGKANKHAEGIADMPAIWMDCLNGTGEIDLSSISVLAENQFMWSPGGLGSSVTAFFASKAMNSKVDHLKQEELPEVFKASKKFKGTVYKLDEIVMDVKSLLQALRNNVNDYIYKAEIKNIVVENEKIKSLQFDDIELTANKFVFTAGLGNEMAADALGMEKGKTYQRRPLKQVIAKGVPYTLYAHCITTDPRPRATITAHPLTNGTYAWYMGGLVGVYGVDKTDAEAINFAQTEMKTLFPWIEWEKMEWSTLEIDRAEPYVSTGWLPDGPAIKEAGNTIITWPTKLTYAPALAHEVIKKINVNNLKNKADTLPFSKPEIGLYPWENK